MPTRHRRHTLTETGGVAVALACARESLPDATDGQRLRHLVALGADTLARQAHDALRVHRRQAQLDLIAAGRSSEEQALVLADALDAA